MILARRELHDSVAAIKARHPDGVIVRVKGSNSRINSPRNAPKNRGLIASVPVTVGLPESSDGTKLNRHRRTRGRPEVPVRALIAERTIGSAVASEEAPEQPCRRLQGRSLVGASTALCKLIVRKIRRAGARGAGCKLQLGPFVMRRNMPVRRADSLDGCRAGRLAGTCAVTAR